MMTNVNGNVAALPAPPYGSPTRSLLAAGTHGKVTLLLGDDR
jgi:hypothetical protein